LTIEQLWYKFFKMTMILSLPHHRVILSHESQISQENSESRSEKAPEKFCSTSRKRFHFNETVRIRSTLHLQDMTEEEKANTWLSQKEISDIRKVLILEVKSLRTGRELSGTTLRGLEHRIREAAIRRKTDKMKGLIAVLEEQDLQERNRFNNPENIRVCYQRISQVCQCRAHEVAKSDEIEALRIHNMDTQ
jgi:hypothetical protein